MDPYVSISRAGYTSDDVAASYAGNPFNNSAQEYLPLESATPGRMTAGPAANEFLAIETAVPPSQQAFNQGEQCPACGNIYMPDSKFCRECGRKRETAQSQRLQEALQSQVFKPFDAAAHTLSPLELQRLYQGASDVKVEDQVLLHERVIDRQEQKVSKVVTGKKQVITIEKVVEVPQVIVKETEKRIPKPEIIERIIEVPGKVEYRYGKDDGRNGSALSWGGAGGMDIPGLEGASGIGPDGLAIDYGGYGGGGIGAGGDMWLVGNQGQMGGDDMDLAEFGDGLPPGIEPGTKEYNEYLEMLEAKGLIEIREEIIEVPQIVIEERIVHVPGKKQIQERLIEVPKVEWVERIEYDDYVEYREVPVDKIIEVPEIEYKIKEVDTPVPQTYIQENLVDTYKKVPVTQVQEVERVEEVPVMVPDGWQQPNLQAIGMSSLPGSQARLTSSQASLKFAAPQSPSSMSQAAPITYAAPQSMTGMSQAAPITYAAPQSMTGMSQAAPQSMTYAAPQSTADKFLQQAVPQTLAYAPSPPQSTTPVSQVPPQTGSTAIAYASYDPSQAARPSSGGCGSVTLPAAPTPPTSIPPGSSFLGLGATRPAAQGGAFASMPARTGSSPGTPVSPGSPTAYASMPAPQKSGHWVFVEDS